DAHRRGVRLRGPRGLHLGAARVGRGRHVTSVRAREVVVAASSARRAGLAEALTLALANTLVAVIVAFPLVAVATQIDLRSFGVLLHTRTWVLALAWIYARTDA